MKFSHLTVLILAFGLNSCNILEGKSDFQTKCFSSKQATGEYNREMEYLKITGHRESKYAIKIGEGIIKIYDAQYETVWRQDSVRFSFEKNDTYYFESIDPSLAEAPAYYSHKAYAFDNKEKTLSEISTPLFNGKKDISYEIIYYID